MRGASCAQRLEQVAEVLNARIIHLEHLAKHVLLHGSYVNTPAAATELNAVDDKVVVVGAGLQRVHGQHVKVFGGARRSEWVVCRGKACGAALAWVGRLGVCGREEGEVGDPEEAEGGVEGEELLLDGDVVEMVAKGTEGGGAA